MVCGRLPACGAGDGSAYRDHAGALMRHASGPMQAQSTDWKGRLRLRAGQQPIQWSGEALTNSPAGAVSLGETVPVCAACMFDHEADFDSRLRIDSTC